MSITQKDITLLTNITELPDTFGKQGDFLRVKQDGSGDPEWVDTDTSDININRVILGIGSSSNPTLTFIGDTDTGIYSQNANEINFVSNAVQRLKVDNSSVDVGTALNNLNFNVNGISSATRFRSGDGVINNPSYSFTTSGAQDCGMYYNNSGVDELRFSTNGSLSMTMQPPGGTSYTNTKLLINNGTTTNPGLIFSSTATNTGFSGDASNNLYTLTAGSINTTHSSNSFDVGRTNLNNTNLRTLNANGPTNFNTFTNTYTNIINTQITGNRTDGNWYGIDYNPTTGVYIIGSNGSGSGVTRIAVSGSNNLTSWTTYNDTTLYPGFTALGNIRHVAYGPTPNIWVIGSGSSTTGNFYYSSDTINWTNVGTGSPFATARVYNRLKFINGQFVGLSSGSVVVYSSNGTTWASRVINGTSYTLQDIVYSSELRMYVITTNTGAVLYFNDTSGSGITNTTTFTAQTSNVYASSAVSWSPKLSTFIIQNSSVNTQWASSSDGINWRTYTTTAINQNNGRLEWVPDFGGLFVGCQSATNANSIVSRDGITWTQINLTISGQSRGFYYNSSQKVFVFGLDANLTFKNALTDFNNYVDRDNIYNTFNSNIRFADNIEYQIQEIETISGNNHYTPFSFNRPVINFDTTTTNANIYLLGSSFNGRIGSKFTIRKTLNSTNAVRIHGYETCNFVSPLGNIIGFNSQSSPSLYNFIPANYFGSFDLTRIDDINGGTWLIDNLNVFDNSGNNLNIGNLSLNGYLQCNPSSQSATNPAIYFSTNTNSGIYTAGTNLVNISSAGIQKMEIGSGLTIGTNTNLCDTTMRGNLIITNNSYGQLFRFTSPRTTKTASWTLSSSDSRIIEVDNSATCDFTLADLAEGSDYIIHKKGLGTFRIVVPSGFQCNNLTAGTYTIFLGAIQGHIRLTQITSTPTSPVEFIYDNTAH